ncbi:MAG: hypothetical protein IJ547_00940, partial [Clostridia bacterium]|nr:hypothetical protein [Clostridia bacterium]
MAKQPKTAIERNARAAASNKGLRAMRKGRPSQAFLHTKKWKKVRNLLLLLLAVEVFLFSLN